MGRRDRPTLEDEEVVHVASSRGSHMFPRGEASQDCVALAEIEWCGELMIAASAAREERLSSARIDEVLEVDRAGERTPLRIPTQAMGTR